MNKVSYVILVYICIILSVLSSVHVTRWCTLSFCIKVSKCIDVQHFTFEKSSLHLPISLDIEDIMCISRVESVIFRVFYISLCGC